MFEGVRGKFLLFVLAALTAWAITVMVGPRIQSRLPTL